MLSWNRVRYPLTRPTLSTISRSAARLCTPCVSATDEASLESLAAGLGTKAKHGDAS